jgi:hypothetical protein
MKQDRHARVLWTRTALTGYNPQDLSLYSGSTSSRCGEHYNLYLWLSCWMAKGYVALSHMSTFLWATKTCSKVLSVPRTTYSIVDPVSLGADLNSCHFCKFYLMLGIRFENKPELKWRVESWTKTVKQFSLPQKQPNEKNALKPGLQSSPCMLLTGCSRSTICHKQNNSICLFFLLFFFFFFWRVWCLNTGSCDC